VYPFREVQSPSLTYDSRDLEMLGLGVCNAPLLSSGHELSTVAGLMRLLNLARWLIPESRMQISRVVPLDPCGERLFQLQWTGPFAEPEQLLLQRSHEALRVGVPLRVVVTRDRLRDPERRARLHEGDRRRLTPIVAHQREALLLDALRALPLHGLL